MLQGFQKNHTRILRPWGEFSSKCHHRKTDFEKWRENICFDEDFLVAKHLNIKFSLRYRIVHSGMTVNVKFNSKYFVRSTKLTQEGQAFMLSLDRGSIEINNIPQ